MDLVAEGLSDSEIARVLGVSLEIVRIHIDHARQKLGIKQPDGARRAGTVAPLWRDEYPGSCDPGSVGRLVHPVTPQPKVSRSWPQTAVRRSSPSKSAARKQYQVAPRPESRARTAAVPAPQLGRHRRPANSSIPVTEIAASLFAQAALNAPRPGSSSYSIFMIAAFAALIYELDGANHAVQAFDFGDGLADVFTSSTASDAKGLAAVALPGFANFGGTRTQCTMGRSHSSSPKAIQSPETAASFMLAMPTRRMAAATERTLFPKVPGPLTLSRRPRTKPRSVTQRRQAGITGPIRVDRNRTCMLPTTAPKPLSAAEPRETI